MRIANLASRTRNLVLAGAAGAGLAGLMVWSAGAVIPTNGGPNITWVGGVPQIMATDVSPVGLLYSVPAGSNFMLTDLIVANSSTASGAAYLYSAPLPNCLTVAAQRTTFLTFPHGTTVVPLNTGFGFGGGQHICVSTTTGTMSFNLRGYLFR